MWIYGLNQSWLAASRNVTKAEGRAMKRQRYHVLLLAFVLALSISGAGCSLLGEDEPSAPLVLGESIEGSYTLLMRAKPNTASE